MLQDKLVKMRTEVKNRVHASLDKHRLKCPYTTLFSKKGVKWLRSLRLGFIDDAALKSFPALLEAFDMQISLGLRSPWMIGGLSF